MRWLSAGFRLITRFEALCLQVGILGIAGLTTTNVVLRLVTGESLLFANELCRFLIVWVTFLGIGYAAGAGRHIRMTALYDALGAGARKAVMLFVTATTAGLLGWLTWLSLAYVFGTVRPLGAVSAVLQVPMYAVYVAAPLGLFMGSVQYLLAFAQNLLAPGVYVAFGRPDTYDEPPAGDTTGGLPPC